MFWRSYDCTRAHVPAAVQTIPRERIRGTFDRCATATCHVPVMFPSRFRHVADSFARASGFMAEMRARACNFFRMKCRGESHREH